nr:chromatin remodeling protein EBS-like isoform X1 [Ipomoea batatas]
MDERWPTRSAPATKRSAVATAYKTAAPLKTVRVVRYFISSTPVGAGSHDFQFCAPSQPVPVYVLDSGEDALILNWLLARSSADMSTRWEDLLTLVSGSEVGVTVIDAWSCVFNCMEATKDLSAPSRVFASTYHPACVGMSVEQTKQLDQFVCSDCASDPNVNDDAATFSTSLRFCE